MARDGKPISFAGALIRELPGWIVWALATWPLIRLSQRFPLLPLRARTVAVHVAAWLAVGVVFVSAGMVDEPAQIAQVAPIFQHLIGWSPSLLMAYLGVAGAGHAMAYAAEVQRAQREKAALATQLVEAQLGALRMQLQPHFLFNTLNSIAMLVRSADHARAVEMIALLGDVLRTLLRSSSELEAPLAAELALLRRYLEIEQIRFGDRLRVRWDVAADAEPAQVPPLILQPVVENALRHGLWPRSDGGELVICARRAGDALELEVCDDGVGLPAAPAAGEGRGVGLANVRARLERMYGAAGGFELARRTPRGVAVRMRMPFHTQPREAAHG
jgi:LytS/YehU family sensor histidine kinase